MANKLLSYGVRLLLLVMCLGCGPAVELRDAAADAPTSLDTAAPIDAGADVHDPADGSMDMFDDGAADGGVAPDPACTIPGCLRSATHVGDFTIDDIQPFLELGVRIDNGYSVWTLSFYTEGGESLATVTVPFRAGVPLGGFHIVGNNHGTSGLGVDCAFTGTVFGTGLAGLYGARGMIGVALDYPGLGTTGRHPYLVKELEGRSVLDALRAARHLAQWQGVPVSGRFATTGLSQGGHATLAAAQLHTQYAPELDIRAFGAAAPASVWEEHWRAGAAFDGPHLVFHALLTSAWADHYAYAGPELWASTFDASVIGERCIFDIRGNDILAAVIPSDRTELFSTQYLQAFESGEWGAFGAFAGYFALNRIEAFPQSAPLRIYQGDADAIVPEYATAEMVDALREGGVEVEYIVVEGGTHLNVAFGFVATAELRTEESIEWIREHLDAE